MNMLLNHPLPIKVNEKNKVVSIYENRVLIIFAGMVLLLMFLSWFLVDLGRAESKGSTPMLRQTEEEDKPLSIRVYV